MKKIRVAVLMGGKSSEREVSLKSGTQALLALNPERYEVTALDPATDLDRLVNMAPQLDAALIMLHGRGGEDGAMQGLLDLLGVPYQCSDVLGCALAQHKPMAKDRLKQWGLPVAKDVVLERGQGLEPGRIIGELGLPVVIKPAREGSSFGISLVYEPSQMGPALEKAFALDDIVMAEKLLQGRELTVSVIGNDRPEPLPVVEIIPSPGHTFFDYEAKYVPGQSSEICPAQLPDNLTHESQLLAIMAHRALGLKGYSRTDMIYTEQGIFLLEVNTVPGMTANSLLPLAARTAGLEMPALLDKLVDLALARKTA